MHTTNVLLLGLISISFLPAKAKTKSSPPVAPVKEVVDDYYGTKVVDPYRYMEKLDDPKVQTWLNQQNEYARATLRHAPERDTILQRLIELDHDTDSGQVNGVVHFPGDSYMYLKRLPSEDVAKLYIKEGLSGPEKLIVDPTRIKIQGATGIKGENAIGSFAVSSDLKYVALTIVPGGSVPNIEVHVIEVATGRETGDFIPRTIGGVSWMPDNRSFLCSRLQKVASGAAEAEMFRNIRSYLHRLGSVGRTISPSSVPVSFHRLLLILITIRMSGCLEIRRMQLGVSRQV